MIISSIPVQWMKMRSPLNYPALYLAVQASQLDLLSASFCEGPSMRKNIGRQDELFICVWRRKWFDVFPPPVLWMPLVILSCIIFMMLAIPHVIAAESSLPFTLPACDTRGLMGKFLLCAVMGRSSAVGGRENGSWWKLPLKWICHGRWTQLARWGKRWQSENRRKSL